MKPNPRKRVPEVTPLALQSKLPSFTGPVSLVPLSPARGLMLAVCWESGLEILDPDTGVLRSSSPRPPSGTVFSAFAPFQMSGLSTQLIAAGTDGVHEWDRALWDADKPCWGNALFKPGEAVRCLCQVVRSGAKAIAIGTDSGLFVWSNTDGRLKLEGQHGRTVPLIPGPITAVAQLTGSRNDELLVAGQNVLASLELTTGRVHEIARFRGHRESAIECLFVAPDVAIFGGTFSHITPVGKKGEVVCRRIFAYDTRSPSYAPAVSPHPVGSDGFVRGVAALSDSVTLATGRAVPKGQHSLALFDGDVLSSAHSGEGRAVFAIGATAYVLYDEGDDCTRETKVRVVRLVRAA